ncbi:MAG: polysaccharide lyase [Hyphomicrobiaceae bacterium]
MKNLSKTMSNRAILLNGAAILIVAASGLAVLRSALFHDDAPPCLDRYAQGTSLSLERNGQPLGTADLQARVGGTDWSLIDHARVVKLKSGPGPHALEMNIGSLPPRAEGSDVKPGIGFTWSPRGFEKAAAACLAYSVFLPEDFDFGKGGVLPGLVGTTKDEAAEIKEPAFSTRYAWRADGSGDIHTHLPGWSVGRSLGNDRRGFEFAKGKWMSLEQEVVLNAPGAKNGMIRVWVDGALRFEKSGLVFRQRAGIDKDAERDVALPTLAGVLSQVAMPNDPPKAKNKVWLTSFELRWK